MKNKLLYTFIMFLILWGFIPNLAKAVSSEDYFLYREVNNTLQITGIKDNYANLEEITIPKKVSGVNVDTIYSFGKADNLKRLIIPNTITDIYIGAFDKLPQDTMFVVEMDSNAEYYLKNHYNNRPYEYIKYNINDAIVSTIKDQDYNDTSVWPKPTIQSKDRTKTLVLNKNYKLTYSNNNKIGTASITITGINNYFGSRTIHFKITKKNMANAKVSTIKVQNYTGKAIKPKFTVKHTFKLLKQGKDYTVKFSNNKKCGTATITLKGKGNYIGTKKITFKIRPKSPTIKSFKATEGGFKITWKKVSGISGYQIRYKKGDAIKYKNKKVSSSKSSLQVSNLGGGMIYEAQVRSFRKEGKKTYYSAWAINKVMTITTKQYSITYNKKFIGKYHDFQYEITFKNKKKVELLLKGLKSGGTAKYYGTYFRDYADGIYTSFSYYSSNLLFMPYYLDFNFELKNRKTLVSEDFKLKLK